MMTWKEHKSPACCSERSYYLMFEGENFIRGIAVKFDDDTWYAATGGIYKFGFPTKEDAQAEVISMLKENASKVLEEITK